ncbi:hypothetical protein [Pyxidicoccus trucidator]|uniref:hypothetical protein n=1 Tax=Pyxidicoccus trucidator TaxID=2709662 RepID=UPI0013DC0C10|nr:hypothetical protein [Pyxidicoccus trucidator]
MGAKRASAKKASIPGPWDQLFKKADSFERDAGPSSGHVGFDDMPRPHLNKGAGDNTIAFVFAAPGRLEADWCRPVAGATGLNLNRILGMLKVVCEQHFPHLDRYHYRITNSVSNIMYDEQDGDSEPSNTQIKEKGNLSRFADEISCHTIIICFGACAWLAATTKFPSSEQSTGTRSWYRASKKLFIKTAHLSQLGLNQIRKADLPGITPAMIKRKDKEATRFRHELRLKVCATEILAALRDSSAWEEVPTSKAS